jgi:hypothetical protein
VIETTGSKIMEDIMIQEILTKDGRVVGDRERLFRRPRCLPNQGGRFGYGRSSFEKEGD